MEVNITNRFSGDIQFKAEIDCIENTAASIKLGLAVKMAIKNGTDLRSADLRGADLRGANLRNANLMNAHLRGADLRDADLRDAILWNALLWNANLQSADLQSADLRDADLRSADLRSADLRGANLRNANLLNADLQNANLLGADLDFSCWPLCCKSRHVKADDRIISQLLFHATRVDISGCSGGVREAVEFLRQMAVCNLFPEYRSNISKCKEFETD